MSLFGRIRQSLSWFWPWKPEQDGGETHGLQFAFSRTRSGQYVTEELALTISAVYAAVRILSETSASLPLNVYRQIDDRTKEIARKHPVYRVLHDTPNSEMTATVFWRTWEIYKLLWGNAYAEIGWDAGGNCRALWLLEPWRVTPKRDDRGTLYYEIRETSGGPREIAPEDMLHVPNMSLDGIEGRSVIRCARESLGMTLAAEGYGSSFFGSGGVPSGVLEHPGKLGPDARKQMREEWQAVHSPAHGGRANEVAVLWEGMKYSKIGIPPEDAQFLETRAFQIPEICRWFNLPPHFLRDLSRATFSNIEEQGIEFVVYTLTPQLVEREQELNRKLLTVPEHYCKHNVYALLRGNMAAQAQFFREMRNVGAFSPNDVRELMDLNPVEGGDIYTIQLQQTTLERFDEEIDARTREPEPPAAPEKPPETPAKPEENRGESGQSLARVLTAQRACVVDAAARLTRVELTAVNRATNRPQKFTAFLDEFYGRFEGLLCEAILPPVAAYLAHGPLFDQAESIAKKLAAEHVQWSRDVLLEAAEVTVDRLTDSVAETTAGWEVSRPEKLAAAVHRLADEAKPMPVPKKVKKTVQRDERGRLVGVIEESV